MDAAKELHTAIGKTLGEIGMQQLNMSAEWINLNSPNPAVRYFALEGIKDKIANKGLGAGTQGLINLVMIAQGVRFVAGKGWVRTTPLHPTGTPEYAQWWRDTMKRPPESIAKSPVGAELLKQDLAKRTTAIPEPDLTSPTPITQQAIDLAKNHIGDLDYAKTLRQKWTENGKVADELKATGKMDEYADKVLKDSIIRKPQR